MSELDNLRDDRPDKRQSAERQRLKESFRLFLSLPLASESVEDQLISPRYACELVILTSRCSSSVFLAYGLVGLVDDGRTFG